MEVAHVAVMCMCVSCMHVRNYPSLYRAAYDSHGRGTCVNHYRRRSV